MASFAVGETLSFIVRQAMDVEKIFRDVDANGKKGSSFPRLCLSSGLVKPRYPFRPKEKTGVIQL